MNPFRKLVAPAASLLILTLAACATPTTGTDASKVASAIGHVKPSKQDTCETQKQVAAQSSRIDTIVKNKEVVYKADCATKG
jgi:ABC-type Fe3+-hydroxamate transport system substrate-binding protein